jgi:choline-sulfatase
MLRDLDMKLIYYAGMEPQLFDLESDPNELTDLAKEAAYAEVLKQLIASLRTICDPEAINSRAKADQRAMMNHWGGADAVRAEGMLVYTPPPGAKANILGKSTLLN